MCLRFGRKQVSRFAHGRYGAVFQTKKVNVEDEWYEVQL